MELLVVVGIIAVLIGILLPVINKSRQASITLKCQTQLRELYHGLSMYAVDNKGRLPWGQFMANDSLGRNWVSWQTIVNQYYNPKASLALRRSNPDDIVLGDNQSSNLFLCPGVAAIGEARSSYACNIVAMPDKDLEEAYTDTSKQPLLQPSLMAKLYPHNILLFDTGAVVNSEALYAVGYDVDKQYFLHPEDTMARFFRGDDPYSGNPDRGNGVKINTETNPDQNRDWIDPHDNSYSPRYPYQGNIRYRHNSNRVANFCYADGHVESLRPDQVIRYMFKLRWPPGMPASTGGWDEDTN